MLLLPPIIKKSPPPKPNINKYEVLSEVLLEVEAEVSYSQQLTKVKVY